MKKKCQTHSIDETGRILGIGRSAAYAAVARGEIPSIRVGKRLLVPREALRRLLESADSVPSQDDHAGA
jgi:excisionase family DNA binding protein